MDTRVNDYMDIPEKEALTPEDSLTRLYALEEVRELDHEVKRHRLKYRVCSKNLYNLSQIYRLYSSK